MRTAMTSSCAFPINGSSAIAAVIGLERAKIFAPAFVLAYQSGDWGAYGKFSEWFTTNRVHAYAQTAPLNIYQGDADPIVYEARTSAVVESLRAGGVAVGLALVGFAWSSAECPYASSARDGLPWRRTCSQARGRRVRRGWGWGRPFIAPRAWLRGLREDRQDAIP